MASVLSLAAALNKLDDTVRYQFGEAVGSVRAFVCGWVCCSLPDQKGC